MEHTVLLLLFTCQPTKSSKFSRSGVNVRAHLLRKNYSRDFSSIQSAPVTENLAGSQLLTVKSAAPQCKLVPLIHHNIIS